MSDARLKSFFDRLNKLMGERDDLGKDIAEVMREATSAGFDPAVLRLVLAEERKRTKNQAAYDERIELADVYREAAGLAKPAGPSRVERAAELFAAGKSVREVGKILGIGKSEAGRLRQLVSARPKEVSREDVGTVSGTAEPHDPETGEVLEEPAVEVKPAAPVACALAAPVVVEEPAGEVVIPPVTPAPAPVVGKDWPEMPPFLARPGALQ
jgi:uncharacterized protein (UPF0335 family)